MTHTSTRLATTVALAASLLGALATPATAKPTVEHTPKSEQCPITRVGLQIVFCDNLSGDDVPAPLWIPPILPLTS